MKIVREGKETNVEETRCGLPEVVPRYNLCLFRRYMSHRIASPRPVSSAVIPCFVFKRSPQRARGNHPQKIYWPGHNEGSDLAIGLRRNLGTTKAGNLILPATYWPLATGCCTTARLRAMRSRGLQPIGRDFPLDPR